VVTKNRVLNCNKPSAVAIWLLGCIVLHVYYSNMTASRTIGIPGLTLKPLLGTIHGFSR
jgi:hypothetical protein